MSVCFSTRSSLRSQRKEREKGGKMSLFSLKKHSLSLSLFLFSSFSFFLRYVLAVDSFFFSSLLHFYSWVKSSVGLLSLFPLLVFGGRSDKHIRSSLSLSSKKRAFWKTPTKPDDLPEQRVKREILVFERSTPEDSFARERSGRKKKMDWISPLIAARTAATQRRTVASKRRKRIHPRTNLCACVCGTLRPPPRGMPPKFILPSLYYIRVCVYST